MFVGLWYYMGLWERGDIPAIQFGSKNNSIWRFHLLFLVEEKCLWGIVYGICPQSGAVLFKDADASTTTSPNQC